jgi:replicative DNA helicase
MNGGKINHNREEAAKHNEKFQGNGKKQPADPPRPVLSDLRESGEIEQDADVVMFIYRDEVYNRDENNPNRGTAEILIRKHRRGRTGPVQLAFISPFRRFEELAPQGVK